MGGPAGRSRRARRVGQHDLPSGRRAVGAPAERRRVRRAGGEGASLAADPGPAAPAADTGAGRDGPARRGVPATRGRSTGGSRARLAMADRIESLTGFAADVAAFLAALYEIDAREAGARDAQLLPRWDRSPRTTRNGAAIRLLAGEIDAAHATEVWDAALGQPPGRISPSGCTAMWRRRTCWSRRAGSAPWSTSGARPWVTPRATSCSPGPSSTTSAATLSAAASTSTTRPGPADGAGRSGRRSSRSPTSGARADPTEAARRGGWRYPARETIDLVLDDYFARKVHDDVPRGGG